MTITRQKSKPQTGANAHRAVMQCPKAARIPTAAARVIQKVAATASRRSRARDQEAAHEDDRVGGEHPRVQRRPPEVERFDARLAEHDERDHQPDVRRVEDVRAAVADDVLRQEGERGDGGEHVPGVGGPRLVGRCPRDPQDQRHAAPGQHRARRPHERPGPPERDRHLDHRAAEDGGEDLRHADLEAEPELSEDVDRDDDRGDVQARVAGLRQEHGVGGPAERERPAGHILPPSARSSGRHPTTAGVGRAAGEHARAGDGLHCARSAAGVRPRSSKGGGVHARSSMGTARYGRSPGNGRMRQ